MTFFPLFLPTVSILKLYFLQKSVTANLRFDALMVVAEPHTLLDRLQRDYIHNVGVRVLLWCPWNSVMRDSHGSLVGTEWPNLSFILCTTTTATTITTTTFPLSPCPSYIGCSR